MRRRVVVTGMGVLSPIGNNLKEAWSNIVAGKSGISRLQDPAYDNLPCKIAGLIIEDGERFNPERHFTKSELRSISPATMYALVASKEALSDAGLTDLDERTKEATGVAIGMGMVDLRDICATNTALCKSYNQVSPFFVPRILANMASGQVSIRYGFRGPNHAVSTACATGAHAIGDSFRFIRNGDADIMVCGGTEACVSPLAVAAFARLRALSTSYNEAPEKASRPFDKAREGFVMGEGSAILVLEELNSAKARGARIYAEVLGYGLSGDASHLTAPRADGTGAVLAMERALRDAELDRTSVGYVNAHATSTPLGDAIELKAIKTLLKDHTKNVAVSSTKGAHGHLLGAAGNLESAFTVKAVEEGVYPPTVNLEDNEDPDINCVPKQRQLWPSDARRVALKNAFGFGGTNACLCIAHLLNLRQMSPTRATPISGGVETTCHLNFIVTVMLLIHLAQYLCCVAVILALLILRRLSAMSRLRLLARKFQGYVAFRLRSSTAEAGMNHSRQQASCFTTKGGSAKGTNTPADVKNYKFTTLVAPTKSARDKKRYKVIRLENGLTACLISDLSSIDDRACSSDEDDEDIDDDDDDYETGSDRDDGVGESPVDETSGSENEGGAKKPCELKQKMAAAALCVGVGSFSDPPNIPGMAHFLEHMVFMGSEKFPKENDFDNYITKRGGFSNASTDCETTTFYFECFEKYLERSLDKFAQFFIVPLMKPGSITRERESIESEFQMARPNDEYRKEQLLAALFNPSVPVNQFSWGNLITLKENVKDDVLYKALHAFRKRHYSAHRMTLAIQARLPIETLQSYVLECFSAVPTNDQPPLDFAQYADVIFDTPSVNKIYYIIPVKNVMQVDLTWALPPLLRVYKSKPQHYVSWLLGHEGKGSLMSQLRKRVWALSMYTGNGESGSEHNSMYSYFTTTLVLTQAGLDHLFEVVELVFSYINLLRQVGPQERIFNEIKLIEDTSFAFADEKEAADMVENLAEQMQFYPSEDYLTGSELYFEYKPEDIQMVLNHLRPDKVNIMVLNKKMPSDIVCDKVEPWFKTPYTTRDIPNEWLIRWTNVEPLSEFDLPEPNRFLTTDFSLLPKLQNNPDYPVKVLETDTIELWYRFDQKFQMPTAFYYYYLISPLKLESPINASMLDMLTTMLAIEFTEEGYPAQVAELEYSFYPGDKGMLVSVNGYSEKLPILLELITKHIRQIGDNLTPEMFEAVKENQSMLYYNKFLKPSSLIKDVRLNLLLNSYWPPIEKHAAISKVTFEMMKSFAERFIANLYVKALVQGNVKKETAVMATEKFVDGLGCQPLLPNTFPKIRVVQLPKGDHCCRLFSFNTNDPNSIVTNYYQCGPFSIKMSVIIDLVMMIIEEPLFNVLRTKEQLGYSVSCEPRDTYRILGYSITVNGQAAKHTTHKVDERIEAFIKHAQKLLKKMTDKKMAQFKNDLIKVKRCADVILKQEVRRNWNEIVSGDYMFDRTPREIRAIEETKAADVKKFWEEHNAFGSKANLQKLSFQVVGYKEATKKHHPEGTSTDERAPVTPEAEKVRAEYHLSLVGAQDGWKEHRPDEYYVRDIGSFKHNLFLYPSTTSLV